MPIDRERLDALKIDRDQEQRSSRRLPLIVGTAVLLIIAAVTFGLARSSGATEVTVATAASIGGGSASAPATVLNASGYVTARRQATVSSKVTGRVIEVLVEEGMPVREGQLLARLDAATADSEVRLAAARVSASQRAMEETRVRIDEAQLDLQRASALADQQISSRSEADKAGAQLKALRARLEAQASELEVAQRQLELSRQNASETRIVAPFDGIVISKNAQAGEMISPMSSGGFTRTGICTIVDMNSLEIEVDVNEAYINRVTADQRVIATLDAYPDWQIPAHVIAVVPAADRQKATVRVRIGIDEKDPRILPDMGAKVAFVDDSPTAGPAGASSVSIPRSALRRDGDQDIVFVINGERAERRAVSVASTEGEQSVIRAGLSSGEKVVVSPPETLQDGDRVKQKEG